MLFLLLPELMPLIYELLIHVSYELFPNEFYHILWSKLLRALRDDGGGNDSQLVALKQTIGVQWCWGLDIVEAGRGAQHQNALHDII